MDRLPINYTPWNDRLAMDIALLLEGSGEPLQDVLQRHGIGAAELLVFNKDPLFLKKVDNLRTEVRDKGLSFKLKARAQAEELLTTSWGLIHSPDVSAAVKADLIKSTVKWAGLEPRPDAPDAGGQSGVTISIRLGGQEHTATLKDVTPERQIEHSEDT